ncbi:MAG TPA: DNA polymerase/3'-5' exonuclease PolX, partial [Deltaproteobacteria bacterium]|nr:DNA polymerase/3'-5' exonuclease PolX [Deltaproteobacteria bacterium]
MPVHNHELSAVFQRLADLLEIQGADRFRVRAYRNAARTIESHPGSIADMVQKERDIQALPGIGRDLADKIREYVKTGRLRLLEDLEKEIPRGLITLTALGSIGPKRARALYEELGVSSLEELAECARRGEIARIRGFGAKTERKILEEIAGKSGQAVRTKFINAHEIAQAYLAHLRGLDTVKQAVVAGSYRRKKDTVGDLDILVTCDDPGRVMDRFTGFEDVETIVSKGSTRSTVVLRSGLQIDLRVVPDESYGAALHYFTGSREHSIAVRKMAMKKGLKINEYGVFSGERLVAGRTEEDVYRSVGLHYIEPELRENRGEIEAALRGELPRLITLEDIRGDLHAHTSLTDGRNTLEEMVEAARSRRYEYLAVTNHSPQVRIARGITSDILMKQLEEIDSLGRRYPDITILKSAEVDILKDGSLDYPDEVLDLLDFTVCSIHYHLHLSRDRQTERVLRAMDNPRFTIFGHPTGRLINEREPYEIDLEKIIEAAREKGCYLELNAHPDRLDLDDISCRAAKSSGVMV